ncbi:DUF1289 domain-containing protein [Pseudomonas duriflava]|uniref:DUF1289 domain-containing protein n=1 Tax=Pseudomonas duriflava TaxID=459528 RepID=UPI0011A8126B|nr:DUF1289 domain-containing protein [Pseudomonas duriflava]
MTSTSAPSERSAGATVESPCIRRCCLDDHDVCLGCGRTLADILVWSKASGTERQAILTAARARQARRSR